MVFIPEFEDTADQRIVTKYLHNALLYRLHGVPNDETGKRCNCIVFRGDIFHEPLIVKGPFPPGSSSKPSDLVPEPDVPPVKLLSIGYDNYAIDGYGEFCNLRAKVFIPNGMRFQVSLRTPLNALALYESMWRATMEAICEEAPFVALRRIQAGIPADNLAIQRDLAPGFAYPEDLVLTPAWFTPRKEGSCNVSRDSLTPWIAMLR